MIGENNPVTDEIFTIIHESIASSHVVIVPSFTRIVCRDRYYSVGSGSWD